MPAAPSRLGGDDSRMVSAPTSSGVAKAASAEPAALGTKPSSSRNDAAAYIGELTSILAQLSRQHRLATLNYLLELARMEADSSAASPARRKRPRAAARE